MLRRNEKALALLGTPRSVAPASQYRRRTGAN
jgi:hypothetical protein